MSISGKGEPPTGLQRGRDSACRKVVVVVAVVVVAIVKACKGVGDCELIADVESWVLPSSLLPSPVLRIAIIFLEFPDDSH